MENGTIRTPKTRVKFLEALRSPCNVSLACELRQAMATNPLLAAFDNFSPAVKQTITTAHGLSRQAIPALVD